MRLLRKFKSFGEVGVCTVFRNLESVHLTKDVGMIPVAFSKILNKKSIIIYNHRGVEVSNGFPNGTDLLGLSAGCAISFYVKVSLFLLMGKIDLLNLYHVDRYSFLMVVISRILKVKVYVKADLDIASARLIAKRVESSCFFRFIYGLFFRAASCVSFERQDVFDLLRTAFPKGKFVLVPNGICRESVAVQPLDVDCRLNNVLVVGRIGAYPKNHEVIIDFLLRNYGLCKASGWRFYFCGPVENQNLLGLFDKLDGVAEYLGVLGRDELFEAYANAKVFLMSSRYEGFSLALSEAAFMGCYVISTNVGGADYVTNGSRLGSVVDNTEELEEVLFSLCMGHMDEKISNSYVERLSFARSALVLEDLLVPVFETIWCESE